jgi:hypothetical protein
LPYPHAQLFAAALLRVGTDVAVVLALVGVAAERSLGLGVDAGARGGGVLLVCAVLTLMRDDLLGAGARAGGVENVVGCTAAAVAKNACVGDGGGDVRPRYDSRSWRIARALMLRAVRR